MTYRIEKVSEGDPYDRYVFWSLQNTPRRRRGLLEEWAMAMARGYTHDRRPDQGRAAPGHLSAFVEDVGGGDAAAADQGTLR